MEFHPLKYLHALASRAAEADARIYEHVPLQGSAGTLDAMLFRTKLALYSTYAIAARIPAAAVKEMIWSDTADP